MNSVLSRLNQRSILVVILAVSAALLSVLATTVVQTAQAQVAGGAVHGDVLWIDMYGDAHAMPWAQVTATSATEQPVVTYTTDGTFGMWLFVGTWDITASSSPGFIPQTISGVVVTSGSSTSLEFTLEPSGRPIPELPPWVQPLVLVLAVMVTAIAVRRYKPRTRGQRQPRQPSEQLQSTSGLC